MVIAHRLLAVARAARPGLGGAPAGLRGPGTTRRSPPRSCWPSPLMLAHGDRRPPQRPADGRAWPRSRSWRRATHGWVAGAVIGGLAASVKVPGGLVCIGVALLSLPAGRDAARPSYAGWRRSAAVSVVVATDGGLAGRRRPGLDRLARRAGLPQHPVVDHLDARRARPRRQDASARIAALGIVAAVALRWPTGSPGGAVRGDRPRARAPRSCSARSCTRGTPCGASRSWAPAASGRAATRCSCGCRWRSASPRRSTPRSRGCRSHIAITTVLVVGTVAVVDLGGQAVCSASPPTRSRYPSVGRPLGVQRHHVADRAAPAELLGPLTRGLPGLRGRPRRQLQHGVAEAPRVGLAPGAAALVDQLARPAVRRGHDRACRRRAPRARPARTSRPGRPTARCRPRRSAAASSSRSATCPWKVTGASVGDLLELVAVRAGAVHVEPQRYAAPVQVDGGRDRQVRALLAGEPAHVDQAQDVVAHGALLGWAEGGSGRPRAGSGARRTGRRGDLAELAHREPRRDHHPVELADQDPVQHADRRRRCRSPGRCAARASRPAARGRTGSWRPRSCAPSGPTGSSVDLSEISSEVGRELARARRSPATARRSAGSRRRPGARGPGRRRRTRSRSAGRAGPGRPAAARPRPRRTRGRAVRRRSSCRPRPGRRSSRAGRSGRSCGRRVCRRR